MLTGLLRTLYVSANWKYCERSRGTTSFVSMTAIESVVGDGSGGLSLTKTVRKGLGDVPLALLAETSIEYSKFLFAPVIVRIVMCAVTGSGTMLADCCGFVTMSYDVAML